MLIVTYKPLMLTVIMLNSIVLGVLAPDFRGRKINLTNTQKLGTAGAYGIKLFTVITVEVS